MELEMQRRDPRTTADHNMGGPIARWSEFGA
jgi:hypothetical protein